MATESGPLNDVRLEELLRILHVRKTSSSGRREKFQAKLNYLKERQDDLQIRIVTRLNKDGVNLDIDTLRKRAKQSALASAKTFEAEENKASVMQDKFTEPVVVPQEVTEDPGEEKIEESELNDNKNDDVNPDSKSEEKAEKISAKDKSGKTDTKLENIQEEIGDMTTTTKAKSVWIKEKKSTNVKAAKRISGKSFKNVANASKFVAKVSKRKPVQKLKESK